LVVVDPEGIRIELQPGGSSPTVKEGSGHVEVVARDEPSFHVWPNAFVQDMQDNLLNRFEYHWNQMLNGD